MSEAPSTSFRVTQTFTFAIIAVILSIDEESFTPTFEKEQKKEGCSKMIFSGLPGYLSKKHKVFF